MTIFASVFVCALLCYSMHCEKVGNDNFAIFIKIFNHIWPNEIFLLGQKIPKNIFLRVLVPKFVLFLLRLEKFKYSSHIFLLHGSNRPFNVDHIWFWQSIVFNKLIHRQVARFHSVVYINKLLGVEKSVHIVRCCKWSWLRLPCGIILNLATRQSW